jgi:hypothetical protein
MDGASSYDLWMARKAKWLPWRGTAYAVLQYPCSTRFIFASSDEKTVIDWAKSREVDPSMES